MWCKVSKGQAEDSGEHACGVCRKGIGDNSILCIGCLRWVQKRCRGISGELKSNVDFHCRMMQLMMIALMMMRRCLEGENGLFQSVFTERGCD